VSPTDPTFTARELAEVLAYLLFVNHDVTLTLPDPGRPGQAEAVDTFITTAAGQAFRIRVERLPHSPAEDYKLMRCWNVMLLSASDDWGVALAREEGAPQDALWRASGGTYECLRDFTSRTTRDALRSIWRRRYPSLPMPEGLG
jgi:hypothetical protein